MSTISKDLLDVDDGYSSSKKPRSRSSGHVDRLEEQEQLERRDRERQMKEYHENTRHMPAVHQRTKSDHLSVPIWETHRRPRSSDRNEEQHRKAPRNYRVEEFTPSPQINKYDLNAESPSSSQLPVPIRARPSQPGKQKSRGPPIIIQDNPPTSSKSTSHSPLRSASASPHSPNAQPVLQFQYTTLQNKLGQICTSCERFLDVEAANPRDLTFTKIRETVEGFAEDLHIWSHVANLDGLARIDRSMRHLVDAASEVLDRLLARVTALREACAGAKPRDLKMPLLEVDDDEDVDLYSDGEDVGFQDPTQAPGFVISSLLQSVGMQIRQLKLLSPSLQEATPDAEEEMINVARLVKEADKFFGSEAALQRYSIDPKFAGNAAFVEARFVAGGA